MLRSEYYLLKRKIVVLKKQFIYVHAMDIIIPMKVHGNLSSHYMILMSHTLAREKNNKETSG